MILHLFLQISREIPTSQVQAPQNENASASVGGELEDEVAGDTDNGTLFCDEQSYSTVSRPTS